jgi:hypothetical protein
MYMSILQRLKKDSPPVPTETCGDSSRKDHRDLNLIKRDENLVLVQVSLKDI